MKAAAEGENYEREGLRRSGVHATSLLLDFYVEAAFFNEHPLLAPPLDVILYLAGGNEHYARAQVLSPPLVRREKRALYSAS